MAESPSTPMLPEESGGDPTILFENHVLRAGWGLLLFLLLVVLLVALETVALDHFASLQDTPHTALIPRDSLGNFVVLVAAAGASWAMSLLEHRPPQRYGFAGGRKVRLFLFGAMSGAAVLMAFIVFLHRLGYLVYRGQTLFGAALQWKQAGIWAGFFLVVALTEEILARGYLQYTLTRAIASLLRNYFGAKSGVATAFWIAAPMLAAFFAMSHALNAGESVMGLWNAGLFGLLLVASLWRTGSLWWALGFHLMWDWSQSFLVGVHDSGLTIRDHLFSYGAGGRSPEERRHDRARGQPVRRSRIAGGCGASAAGAPAGGVPRTLDRGGAGLRSAGAERA